MFYIQRGDLIQVFKGTACLKDGEADDSTREGAQFVINYSSRPHRGCKKFMLSTAPADWNIKA